MRIPIFALLAAVSWGAGCSTASTPKGEAPKPGEEAPAPQDPAAQKPAEGGQGVEWEALLQKLKQSYEVGEQQKQSQSDEHYRMAERHFQAGDFEKAELECENALKLNSNNTAANALWLNIQFVLGRGKATPQTEEYDKYMKQALVKHQQTLLEIDNAFQHGTRDYNRGEYDDAEREFRTILEYAKWMPTGVELESRRKQALDMLERTREARRKKNLDEEQARLRMIEEEKQRDEFRRMIDQKRELELLFGQAQMYFEKEEYVRCADVCDKILYLNPNLTSVAEMRNVAQRLNHMREGRDNLKNYVEEWKRTFEKVELASIVQADELEFADRETWEEIKKRKPKGIQPHLDEDVRPEDKEIQDKLKSIKIQIDMKQQPLNAMIDYVREITGLNFVIDARTIPNPDELMNLQVTDIPVDSALRILLGDKWVHIVKDGVVLITTRDALKKQVKLELYDVQDLTYGIQDFPGVDISLTPDSIGQVAATDEGQTHQFTGDDLADLIKKTIKQDQWNDADGQSAIHQNGLLIIRNSIEIHKAIRKFLSDLRASTGMLVNVETRFLSVEDNFLRQVGMDFRDVDGARVQGIQNLRDINPALLVNRGLQPQFTDPLTGAPPPLPAPAGSTTAGITGVFGNAVARSVGARVQQIMTNDLLINQFFTRVISPLGGATLQYTLLDDISLEAIIRLVHRSEHNHVLTAPRLTMFNTQRANFRISNQVAYVRDWDVQIATGAVILDPVVDVVQDGISLDVRPIVSADRRYVTLELRPTVATLFPPPPAINFVVTNVTVPGALITDLVPIRIETPILHIQRIRTTVVVPDRGTLMIGGLTTVFDENAESSVPIWRNVPILGNLGSLKNKGLQRKQNIILVRVRIIIPDEEERKRF